MNFDGWFWVTQPDSSRLTCSQLCMHQQNVDESHHFKDAMKTISVYLDSWIHMKSAFRRGIFATLCEWLEAVYYIIIVGAFDD